MKKHNLVVAMFLVSVLSQSAQQIFPASIPADSRNMEYEDMKSNGIRQSPLSCNITALSPRQRLRIRALLDEFHSGRQEVRELSNGYSVRLPAEGSTIRDAAEFISLERLCCPFFDFALQAEREGGPVWLALTGRNGVKEFARLEFGLQQDLHQETGSAKTSATVTQSPLVCNDGALNPAQSDRLVAVLKGLRAAKQEVKELADGYAIRLPLSTGSIQDIGDFMSIVRLCSPYFETALRVECDGGPAWLNITGRQGVKELVKADLGI
jgi:hypothetical protein